MVLKAVVTRGLEEDAARAVDIANHVKGIVLDPSSSVHTHKLALPILTGLIARGWSAEEILKSSKDLLASPLLFSSLIETYLEVADLICLVAQKEYSERSSIDAIVINAAVFFITNTNSFKQTSSTVKKVKERFAGCGINLEEILTVADPGKPGEAKKVG